VGAGVGCGSTRLNRILVRDGSGKTAADGASGMAVAVKGTRDGMTTHLGLGMGELGWTGSEQGVGSRWGVSLDVGGLIDDVAGV
jgi:hypothetical protein